MNLARITRLAVVALPIVAIAGCSSSSSDHSDAKDTKNKLERAASVKTAPSSPSTSPPTAAPTTSNAPCTVAGASAVLAPDTADSIVCGSGWAAGAAHNTDVDYAYLLHDVNGTWTGVDTQQNQAEMQQACANGNPLGIPSNVLAVSPCEVS